MGFVYFERGATGLPWFHPVKSCRVVSSRIFSLSPARFETRGHRTHIQLRLFNHATKHMLIYHPVLYWLCLSDVETTSIFFYILYNPWSPPVYANLPSVVVFPLIHLCETQ